MLGPEQSLHSWHPLRDVGRVENLAIRTLRQRPYVYLMGCGHPSLPNRTVCERGCLESPNWAIPPIRHPEWDPYVTRAYRGKDGKELAKRMGVR